jgi:hypothetical protein
VETGTYNGGLIHATARRFSRIVSIELDEGLHGRAQEMFARLEHVTLLHGDSGVLLPRVVQTLTEPTLFWLDAHYSGPGTGTARGVQDTPIVKELDCILAHPVRGHVVLIDDAREFAGANDYPTLAELAREVRARRPEWSLTVEHDIIRLHER